MCTELGSARPTYIDDTTSNPLLIGQRLVRTREYTRTQAHIQQGVRLTFASRMSSTDRDRPPRPLLLGPSRDATVSLLCLCNGGVELLSMTDPLPVPQSKGENMVPLLKEKRILYQATAAVNSIPPY